MYSSLNCIFWPLVFLIKASFFILALLNNIMQQVNLTARRLAITAKPPAGDPTVPRMGLPSSAGRVARAGGDGLARPRRQHWMMPQGPSRPVTMPAPIPCGTPRRYVAGPAAALSWGLHNSIKASAALHISKGDERGEGN